MKYILLLLAAGIFNMRVGGVFMRAKLSVFIALLLLLTMIVGATSSEYDAQSGESLSRMNSYCADSSALMP